MDIGSSHRPRVLCLRRFELYNTHTYVYSTRISTGGTVFFFFKRPRRRPPGIRRAAISDVNRNAKPLWLDLSVFLPFPAQHISLLSFVSYRRCRPSSVVFILHPAPHLCRDGRAAQHAACSSLIGGVSKQKKYTSDRGPSITAPCFIQCVRYVTRQSATAVAAALTTFFRIPTAHERTRASDCVHYTYKGEYRHNNPFLPPASASYRDSPCGAGDRQRSRRRRRFASPFRGLLFFIDFRPFPNRFRRLRLCTYTGWVISITRKTRPFHRATV